MNKYLLSLFFFCCTGLSCLCAQEAPTTVTQNEPVQVQKTRRKDLFVNNISFDTWQSNMRPDGISELGRVVDIMKKNPNVTIEVIGHTDNVGSPTANQALSGKRASMVKEFLVGKGIDGGRIKAMGFGMAQPLTGNDTAEGKARNRRVEILFYE